MSAALARRIALGAQGFAEPRPTGRVDARQLRRTIARLGVLQLDSVNVFCRAHYMPLYSRLGPYSRDLLDTLAAHAPGSLRRRELVEYWAHEASLIPMESWPLFSWRMDRAEEDMWKGVRDLIARRPELLGELEALVERAGPIRAGETGLDRPARTPGQMWNWHDGKAEPPVYPTSEAQPGFWQWSEAKTALEYLFWAGRITAARRVNFERFYDLPERVIPAAIFERPAPSQEDAQRELVRIAARALGVATEPDLRDYFRLPHADSKARVAELVAAGELQPVEVDGWGAPAYLWPETRRPRRIAARALLSPFDPLVWYRQRTERIFGFRYRIEIYTPAEKRVYGYYVLPFLLGDSLVARVDLKSDRQAGVLRVQSAWLENGFDGAHVAAELAEELGATATWLGLANVEVAPRGTLATRLCAALSR